MSNALAREGIDPATTRKAWDELSALNKKYGALALDTSLAAGGALPPPAGTAVDLVSLGKSLLTGDWGGALMDVIGFVPLIGDAAKGAKVASKLADLRRAIDTANATMARKLEQTKQAAAKYWDDLANKQRKQYDDAINNCKTKECRNLHAGKKGAQYENTPNDPNNGSWTGDRGDSTWVPKDGSAPVSYKNGFPDYSPHSKGDVEIAMLGDHRKDFVNADNAMREKLGDPTWKRPSDHTWHHKEDGVTMQLVPKNVHATGGGASTPHMGGASLHSGGQSTEF